MTKLYEPCSVTRGLKTFAKYIDPCQPAQSEQVDMGRNFSLSWNFTSVTEQVYIMV